MSNNYPAEHTPEEEHDYPIPPTEENQPAEEGLPEIVPPPARRASELRMPVPRARRLLKSQINAVEVAIRCLKKLELGETVDLDTLAIEALVCGASDRQLPLDDDTPHIGRLRERAQSGEFKRHVGFALDELEDALATLKAALAALKAASMLDEPIPGTWGNLHPLLLARKLNVLGHTLLRGRIPGASF